MRPSGTIVRRAMTIKLALLGRSLALLPQNFFWNQNKPAARKLKGRVSMAAYELVRIQLAKLLVLVPRTGV